VNEDPGKNLSISHLDSLFISYARKPQALSLGMNGILSERSGDLFRHVWYG